MSNPLRNLFEKLARGSSFRRSVEVAGQKIELYVSPDAQLKYAKLTANSFDTDLIRIVEMIVAPDSVVWDIGANVGVFTFAASTKARQVISIEADTWLVELLRKSCQLACNANRDIRILPVAVSDTTGFAEFRIARRGRASNALANVDGSSQMGGERMRTFVPTFSLDTLLDLMPAPHFIKMDIEGAEALAFAGATRLISELRPTLYVEVSKKNYPSIAALMTSHDYQIFDQTGAAADGESGANFFFVPKENQKTLEAIASFSKSNP